MDVATPETLEAQDYSFEKVGGCEGVPMKRYCRDHILIFLRWHLLGWGYLEKKYQFAIRDLVLFFLSSNPCLGSPIILSCRIRFEFEHDLALFTDFYRAYCVVPVS